ncbi:MAG TPA: hypothetical protein PK466_05700 [Thermotogota bacterium]|nr:hypothetical protein [Thermotogota bacterium]HPR95802.1 hypothetical protein [Thermotogota bacterium]
MSIKKVTKNFFENDYQNDYEDFNFFSKNKPLNTSNFPQHYFEIAALFSEDCNYNFSQLEVQRGILFISGHYKGKGNELMLKFRHNSDLVVARVQFINQRKGNMTKLFDVLKKIKRRYKLKRIVIESVLTDSMHNWCHKNKFKPSVIHPNCYKFHS